MSLTTLASASDAAPSLSINDVWVTRLQSSPVVVVFTVGLSRPSFHSVVVEFSTRDGSAVAGEDYQASSGSIVIKPGETAARIAIPVLPGSSLEVEDFTVLLSHDEGLVMFRNSEGTARIQPDGRESDQ